MISNAIMSPGMMPARNSLPTETLEMDANSSMAIDGGITLGNTAEDAITAQQNGAGYPLRTISGTVILASSDASAVEEPESKPKNTLVSTLTCASPPRKWPTSARARLIRRSVRPPAFMICAAAINSGIASSTNLDEPTTTLCTTAAGGSKSPASLATKAANNMQNATGTPSTRVVINESASSSVGLPLRISVTSNTSASSHTSTATAMAASAVRRVSATCRPSRTWYSSSSVAEAGMTAYCHQDGIPSVMLLPEVMPVIVAPAVSSRMMV